MTALHHPVLFKSVNCFILNPCGLVNWGDQSSLKIFLLLLLAFDESFWSGLGATVKPQEIES